jgi:dipeptidyl aminopeptidase/acylaminoacyl peptidase
MTSGIREGIVAVSLTLVTCLAAAAPQPLENFARMPQMRDVAISPDGRYVAFISSVDDSSVVMTFDANANSEYRRIAASEPGKFDLDRCDWANNDRLVCSLTGNIRGKSYAEAPFARTMAVDASGVNLKTLDVLAEKGNLFVGKTSAGNLNASQNMRTSSGSVADSQDYHYKTFNERTDSNFKSSAGQRRDQILDVTPDDHDTVLIQANEGGSSYPSVFTLDVNNGIRGVRLRQSPPIRQFVTDGKGNVRLGWGNNGRSNSYFARGVGENRWTPLEKLNAFTLNRALIPITAVPGKDVAYALGDFEGRVALWTLDLTDQHDPEILFKDAQVDLGDPLLTNDRRLFGIHYDLDRPLVHYSDESLRGVMEQINSQFVSRFNQVVDMTNDGKTLVIRAYSDVDEGTYYLFNRDEKKMKRLGSAYPDLRPDSLGTMKPITYKAADGTEIRGYLTVPNGVRAEKLPLIVMPHDGPDARDTWKFSFLRNFLANRGYAVLQMNYRGSSGYGQKWRLDARQEWGGLTYSDITDATRWAIAQGIADPKRVCIAGWGFGGYQALLGAARNSDLYKCSISIAGFSDLPMLQENATLLGHANEVRLQGEIGTDRARLNRDSPLQQVASISNPVLLVHGDMDWQVQIDHSQDMASALKKNKKDYKAVYIKGGSHELDRKSDRMTLLKEVEEFLQKNLGPGAQPGA